MSDRRGQRPSSRSTGALLLLAVALAGCGGSAPAAPDTSAIANPSSDGTARINYDDATDPGNAAQHELVLNQEARADGGMAALIGDNGEAVFEQLDAQASEFSQESLEQIAHLIDTGEMPEAATSVALARMVAMLGSGLPSRQYEPPKAIDLSVFTETGFTTSALLSVATTAIRLADQTIDGTLPRSDHIENTSNGLRQVVELNMTWVIKSGGGKFSFEVQMSVTDNIFDATSGSLVALYTSTSNGKFDVNACPEEGGVARGTYTFQTKHEMNDVSGAADSRSGAGRSIEAPFTLFVGDDAHLLRIETTLEMAADAHGPGGGSGSTAAFDWTASQTLPIVMTPGGQTTSSGGSGLTAQGTGAERAAGSMFDSSTMAQLLVSQIAKETEAFWRSGKCIELTPSRDTGAVDPNEQVDLAVTAAGKFQPAEIAQPISATFSGAQSLDPTGEPVPYPPTFTFIAGANEGDKGTIDLQQVSNRGIGKRTVEFTVGSPHFGGTIHYEAVNNFLNATTTWDITIEVVLLVDDASRALTAEPDGGSTFSYDFHTTGGNENTGSDCDDCPPEPPCTSHGEGVLKDPAQVEPGTQGVLWVLGGLGDDQLHLTIAIPISCGGGSPSYFSLLCGDPDGLKVEFDGDTSYQIDSSCKTDLGRPGFVNNSEGHVEGTLSPLDDPS